MQNSVVVQCLAVMGLAACGGGTPPAMSGRQGMLDGTAVAAKCATAAKSDARPFLVDWDATDISSFERKATRDTIVVHYEGCKLEVLQQCSDPDFAGKFGQYAKPETTSTGLQQVDVKNEGELYAKLPLGAVSFGAKVAAGEELHLKYYATGEAATTRESLYAGDLKKYPGCATATHFVYAFNVGASELSSAERNSVEANAGYAGVGAGGKNAHSKAQLGKIGDVTTCTSNDQRECRAPIRLTLRPITVGDAPVGSTGGGTAVVGGTAFDSSKPIDYAKSSDAEAQRMLDEGIAKFKTGDGARCLQLLDKAFTKDRKLASSNIMQVRALCDMQAGHCEAGGKALRAAIAAADTTRSISDADLDKRLKDAQAGYCAASTAGAGAANDGDFYDRAKMEAAQAMGKKDGTTCRSLFDRIDARKPKNAADREKSQAAMGMASICIVETSSCAEARRYYVRHQVASGLDKKNAEATFDNGVKQGAFHCK